MSVETEIRNRFDAAEDVPPMEGLAPEPEDPHDYPEMDSGYEHNADPSYEDPTGPPPDPDDGPALEREGATFPLNDTGNGHRFALYCGDRAIFVPRVGWHIWDDRRWKLDPDDINCRRFAQSVQERIIGEIPHVALEEWQLETIDGEVAIRVRHDELAQITVEERTVDQKVELEDLSQKLIWIRKLKDRRSGLKSDHRTFAKTSGNTGRIGAMLVEATTSMSRAIDDLDADPLTINTESGILRFAVSGGPGEGFSRTAQVTLEPHAREVAVAGRDAPQFMTKLMPTVYDPDAKCPNFERFLLRVQPDPAMRGFLQRWWGMNMTALPVQKFLFQYGSGANGKSVLADLMGRMLGDYAATVKIESLIGRNRRGGGDATPDLMPLVGARSARASEPEEGERLKEGMIKEMTGGEPILVRQLHKDFIEVRPFFKLTISGNHKPEIRGTDDGIWRRVLLVPFSVQIPPAERDTDLIEKLWAERSGILNWMIDGLIEFLEGGLQEPADVLDATAEYRADSDPIGTYLAESCVCSGSSADFMTSRDLIDGFHLWQDLRGEGTWGQRTVSIRIKDKQTTYQDPNTRKGYSKAKRKSSGYSGIKFTPEFSRQFDSAPRVKGRPVAFQDSQNDSGEGFPI